MTVEDDQLTISPDMTLAYDGVSLLVRSADVTIPLPPPYGSSRRGFVDALDHAQVSPNGSVVVYYKSFCSPRSQHAQPLSLPALRAKLDIARAEQSTEPAAAALRARASSLAPAEPMTAVASAKHAAGAARAALVSPALRADRFETYFEIVRQAPELRELPNVERLRARVPGTAELHVTERLQAVAGPLLALSVAQETEADCAPALELVLFDVRKNAVVFRRPYLRYDRDCHEQRQDLAPFNALLHDFGFVPSPDGGAPETLDLQTYEFDFGDELGLRVDRQRHVAVLSRGERLLARRFWGSPDSPRRAHLLAEARMLVIETNRDSDVCEGLPGLESLGIPAIAGRRGPR